MPSGQVWPPPSIEYSVAESPGSQLTNVRFWMSGSMRVSTGVASHPSCAAQVAVNGPAMSYVHDRIGGAVEVEHRELGPVRARRGERGDGCERIEPDVGLAHHRRRERGAERHARGEEPVVVDAQREVEVAHRSAVNVKSADGAVKSHCRVDAVRRDDDEAERRTLGVELRVCRLLGRRSTVAVEVEHHRRLHVGLIARRDREEVVAHDATRVAAASAAGSRWSPPCRSPGPGSPGRGRDARGEREQRRERPGTMTRFHAMRYTLTVDATWHPTGMIVDTLRISDRNAATTTSASVISPE